MLKACFDVIAKPLGTALLMFSVLGASPLQASDLVIRDGWVRAVPPVSRTTAAYLTVENTSSEGRCLVGASSPLAGSAMLHDMSEKEGVRQMTHLESVHVPAGGTVAFAPGGKHIMLFDLQNVPAEGDVVEVCVHLDTGEQLCAALPVKR